MSSRPSFLVILVGALLLLTSCADHRVRLSYRPEVGDRAQYEIEVRSRFTVTPPDGEPTRTNDLVRLRADHRVLSVDTEGARVQVRLSDASARNVPPRRFVVRIDRAAALVAIEDVEGIPAGALGDLGITDVFPLGATAPPDRPLALGERWNVNRRVRLSGTPATLSGSGRLRELGVEHGRQVATLSEALVIETTGRAMSGAQTTQATLTYRLSDASVQRADARTRGAFEIEQLPPQGSDANPVSIRVMMDIHSRVRRVG